MGISFKVSKKGSRFRPKPVIQLKDVALNDESEISKEVSLIGARNPTSAKKAEGTFADGNDDLTAVSRNEVSFTLSLYPDGYSIGKASENDIVHRANLQDASKLLHPYDRASETIFVAIESGWLPGDILDDIPCKYINGTIICEVRDYRKCASEQGSGIISTDATPTINKVRLKMSLENVVKDIPLISDNSWTYGDLMEVESRIVKALQPVLSLDPKPKLDRLSASPLPSKLNLNLASLRRKRLRQMPNVTVTPTNRLHGKKVCIDQVPESSNSRFSDPNVMSGNMMQPHVQENLSAPNLGPGNMLGARSFVQDGSIQAFPLVSSQPRYQPAVGSGPVNISAASPGGQETMVTYNDNVNASASLHGKRENQDGQTSPLPNYNKRARMILGPDGKQQPQVGPCMDNFQAADANWKNSLLQQQVMARGMQYANAGIQKYPQMFEGVMNQGAGTTSFSAGQLPLRFGPKEEQFESDKLDASELNQGKSDMQIDNNMGSLDPHQLRLQQRLPQHMMRPNLPQAGWSNISQDTKKEEQLPKRKSAQSPRLSAGTLAQSPLSSKSGEYSSNSAGPHIGSVAAIAALASQKDKSAVTSLPAIGGTSSFNSSGNDTLQRQHQAQVSAKRRSNSVSKTTVMNGVGSPASVSNISNSLNANSPNVGTPPMADQAILERFAKIEMVASRHQLNRKRNKVDDYSRKQNTYNPQLLGVSLSNAANYEDFKDETTERQLSKSLLGGNINVLKRRVMNFIQGERVLQGNMVTYLTKSRAKMIMMEKSNDGTVAMHYGDLEDSDILSAEEYLPTLPNTHFADLLAKQFCTLMSRDGYLVESRIELKPARMNTASSSQPNLTGASPNNSTMEMQQYNEAVAAGQSSNDVKPTISGNASVNSHNSMANTRMLPPGNSQALQMSQSLLSGVSVPTRPQQMDQQQLSIQQQQQTQQQNPHALLQQQHQQLQRTQMVLPSNPLSHLNAMGQNSNMHLGGHLVNKHSPLQLQILQQQQQQQPQQQQQQQSQQQQQQQQQQQTQMQQRKMLMGIGGHMGMGNIANSMVGGLGGLGNAMGIGGARGIAGSGISGPMTPILGNVGQNPMIMSQGHNISNAITQQLRSGQMTQAQAALLTSKLRMANRAGMLGGPQSGGIAGASGVRQMHPTAAGLSMLGQSLNRPPNMSQMQRNAMGPMGPPKLMAGMAGMNMYMNQQQQQQPNQQMQLQQQQLQQLQQQQQQQQQQSQPETTTSLQAVVSPSQVGSPSLAQHNQQSQPQQPLQHPSPQQQQQMSQRTPMSPQLSSGAIHATSGGNPEGCPASPQLSSQTVGSIGSMANSPMELQGVNKSNSVNNA
ncbi:Protein PHYTOCHROME-DEPENDENT LATE-FLOWERING [Linum perenne]